MKIAVIERFYLAGLEMNSKAEIIVSDCCATSSGRWRWSQTATRSTTSSFHRTTKAKDLRGGFVPDARSSTSLSSICAVHVASLVTTPGCVNDVQQSIVSIGQRVSAATC